MEGFIKENSRTEEQTIEEPVEEVVEKPEYAPVYIQHLITQEPDERIELNKPKITSTNMKTEGFKTIINGKEIKGNPVTVKWQKIENKDEPKPKVLIETTSEEVPGKTSKAYTKFVKGTAGDLRRIFLLFKKFKNSMKLFILFKLSKF